MSQLNVEGFNIPEIPVRDEGAFGRLSQNMWRNREWQYRQQRQQEEDDWRKLNLIQDLTDLSKHQTSSDVANAIGNKQAADVLQEFTANARNMSPAELQGKISQKMSGVLNGMEGTKNELDLADKQLATIKQQAPDLDFSTMAKDVRADILNRRLKNSNEFANPIEVQPSQINVGDPDFLSKYAMGDKNLRSYFQNPQGMDEMSVYKGTPNSYTKYTAKVPSYKKPNFDPKTLKSGFLTGQGEPSLQFKSSTLPSDALPSSKGQPFEMIDKDVLDNLGAKEHIELLAATRKQVPNYDAMSPTEKEYAQRHVLLNTAKAFDQTNFHPIEVHTPSAALLKYYAGDSRKSGDAAKTINDIVGRIGDKAKTAAEEYHAGNRPTNQLDFYDLDQDEQELAMKQAHSFDNEITGDNIKVIYTPEGKIGLFKKDDGQRIGYINAYGNVPKQTGVKTKDKAVEIANEQNKSSKYSIKGKTYTHQQLLDMGYTPEQIAPYKQ